MPEENDPGEEVLQIHISKGRDLESPKQFVCQGCGGARAIQSTDGLLEAVD